MGVENRNLEKHYLLHRRFMAAMFDRRRNRPRRCMSRIAKAWYRRDAAFRRWLKAKEKAETEAGVEVPKVLRLILV